MIRVIFAVLAMLGLPGLAACSDIVEHVNVERRAVQTARRIGADEARNRNFRDFKQCGSIPAALSNEAGYLEFERRMRLVYKASCAVEVKKIRAAEEAKRLAGDRAKNKKKDRGTLGG